MLGALVVKKVSVVRHQFAVQVQWWVSRQLFELLGRSWHWLCRQIRKLFGFEEQLRVAASSTVTAPVPGHPAAATLSSEPKGKEAASSSSGPAGATRPPTFLAFFTSHESCNFGFNCKNFRHGRGTANVLNTGNGSAHTARMQQDLSIQLNRSSLSGKFVRRLPAAYISFLPSLTSQQAHLLISAGLCTLPGGQQAEAWAFQDADIERLRYCKIPLQVQNLKENSPTFPHGCVPSECATHQPHLYMARPLKNIL